MPSALALDARLARLLAAANKRRPPEQPQLTLAEARTIAKNLSSSALARSQACCTQDGVEPPQVFAVIVMSNHVHLVVRAPHKNLARFIGYFKARVAMSINLLLSRCGKIWHRRYDAQAILSEASATERACYTLDARRVTSDRPRQEYSGALLADRLGATAPTRPRGVSPLTHPP